MLILSCTTSFFDRLPSQISFIITSIYQGQQPIESGATCFRRNGLINETSKCIESYPSTIPIPNVDGTNSMSPPLPPAALSPPPLPRPPLPLFPRTCPLPLPFSSTAS